jgi:hypothetical protein
MIIRLLKKAILLFIAFYIFDYIIGYGLDIIRDNSPDGRYFKSQYSLEKGKEDIVIFGASCAETNFAPSIIEDSLKMTCWNASRGGQGLPFWMCMELGILKRYTPKIAIIDIGEERLSAKLDEFYDATGILRPFYNNHKEIQHIIDRISFFEKYFVHSRLYSYNSSFYYLFRPYFIEGLDGRKEDKGWKPLDLYLAPSVPKLVNINTSKKLNDQSVEMFNEFVTNLTKRGCKVYVVIVPTYNERVISTSTIEYIKKMKNVQIIDFEDNIVYSQKSEFFYDFMHLNREGALLYTKNMAGKIKKLYKK